MKPESVEPLDDVLLSLTVVNALEVAATRREGRALGTLDLLLGVLAVDTTWGWESVQVAASFVSSDDIADFQDPDLDGGGTWHNVPLTRTATRALETAGRIASDYHLLPMPGGALALGLLADPMSAATRAMRAEASIGHEELLTLIQENVLDTSLDGLSLPTAGPPASVENMPMAGRALAMAARIDRGRRPGSVALLAASIELNEDADLDDLLGSMLLDADDLRGELESIGPHEDVAADDVVERARGRFGDDPDVAALIVAAALEESAPLARVLAERGLRPGEVAAQIAEWRSRQEGGASGGALIGSVAALAVLASIATSALLLIELAAGGGWWRLVFLVGIWSGYPKEGPVVGVAVAALLAALVTPLVAIAQLASVLLDAVQARVERDALWARTGVRISLREQRYVVARLLTTRARRGQTARQLLHLRLRNPHLSR